MRVLSDVPPPLKIYPNAATGKNIFIYEDGKKVKDGLKSVTVDKEKEDEGEEEQKGMDWEPPPLFDQEDQDGKEEKVQKVTVNPKGISPQNPPWPSRVSSSSSSSSSNVAPTPVATGGGNLTEEERKRMDNMDKEMTELKNKMKSLECIVTKNNEDISNKFSVLEQQQQSANVDIKNMFAQLMAEMGGIKATISANVSAPTNNEEQRKKARVDSPAPMNT
jgi:hypothetical protein